MLLRTVGRSVMKRQSRILTEVHKTATALHRSSGIDKQTMREFDALCLQTVRELSPSGKSARNARAGRR